MSSTTDYQAKIGEIEAIKNENVKTPNMPVDNFLQEAEDLYHWCIDDVETLVAGGLDRKFIDDLPARAGACREAQSLWVKEWNMYQGAVKEWKEQSPLAYQLKKELLQAFKYAFRNDENLVSQLKKIRAGNGHEDMIQDLNDLAVLGKSNQAPLELIKFDLTLLDKSAETSVTMAKLLAGANGEKQQDSETKLIRDKAYTYLKEAMDEIRACARYVFRNDKNRLKGYLSKYYQHKRKKAKNNIEDTKSE